MKHDKDAYIHTIYYIFVETQKKIKKNSQTEKSVQQIRIEGLFMRK